MLNMHILLHTTCVVHTILHQLFLDEVPELWLVNSFAMQNPGLYLSVLSTLQTNCSCHTLQMVYILGLEVCQQTMTVLVF